MRAVWGRTLRAPLPRGASADGPTLPRAYTAQLTASKRFSITYHKYYKVVTVFDPETNLFAGTNYEQYILHLCGSPKPSQADLDAAKTAGLAAVKAEVPTYAGSLTQKTFQVPVKAAVPAETVSISFMNTAFSAKDNIKYFSEYVVDACLQQVT